MLKLNEDFGFEHLYACSQTDSEIYYDTVDKYIAYGDRYILCLWYDSTDKELRIVYVDDDEYIGEAVMPIHGQDDIDKMNTHIMRFCNKVKSDWSSFENNGVNE